MSAAFIRAGSASASAFARAVSQGSSSDESLIQRIADGDPLAMRTLFARYQVPLYRFVLRIVRDTALAEDILSDVFLDVWRQAPQFEARSAVSTWLLAIARFKGLSALRRRTESQLDDETASTIVDPADDPEILVQKKDSAELLSQSLTVLSAEQRVVIDLAYYHGKSVSEVAAVVGIPESTVKTRMFYARKRLCDPCPAPRG